MNQTLKDTASQVEQRLREYRNYKAICTQAADNIAALIVELEAAEKDAARYLFISKQDHADSQWVEPYSIYKAARDESIDAAIAQGAKTP